MDLFKASIPLPDQFDLTHQDDFVFSLHDHVVSSAIFESKKSKTAIWDIFLNHKITPAKLQNLIIDCCHADGLTAPDIDWSAVTIFAVPDINWLNHVYQSFPAFSVAEFWIHGSHAVDDAVPNGHTPLQIDASTAFGSGEHGTTAGCIEALSHLHNLGFSPETCLDMGTGSGILAIASYKLWECPVIAADIEKESVALTKRHCDANNIQDGHIKTVLCDGFNQTDIQKAKPYDLVIANILAEPLKAMASNLVSVTAEKGYIILSGMLREQATGVISIYEDLGCKEHTRFDRGEWTSVILKKNQA